MDIVLKAYIKIDPSFFRLVKYEGVWQEQCYKLNVKGNNNSSVTWKISNITNCEL